MPQAKIRESNIELLRIVLMVFIVVHHFISSGMDNVGYNKPFEFCTSSVIALLLNSFLCIAVDTFVLITGWFGTSINAKNSCKLWFQSAFYSLLCYIIIYCIIDNHAFSFFSAGKNLCVFTNGRYWFISHYFILLLLTPMLNTIIEYGKTKTIIVYNIISLSVITFIFGWLLGWKIGINVTGYSVVNFIFLYIVGRYLKLYFTPPPPLFSTP